MKKLWIIAVMIGTFCGVTAEYAVAKEAPPLQEMTITGTVSKVKNRYQLTDSTGENVREGDNIRLPRPRKSAINLGEYVDKKVTIVAMCYQVEKKKGKVETRIKTITSIKPVVPLPEIFDSEEADDEEAAGDTDAP